jgi:hypothetical protein
MNLPVTHSHRYARPTGLGFDPSAYCDGMQRVAADDYYSNPLRGMCGIGEGPRPRTGKQWPRYMLGALGATDQQDTAVIGSAAASIAGMIPGVGPAAAVAIQSLATVAVAIETLFAGCGATCTQASNIANQVGDQMSSAMSTYMNSSVHTASMQTAYLALFDAAWAQLQQACGNSALGAAGQRCISDRQAGACVWTSSPWGWNQVNGTWTYTWAQANGSGTVCWNWFNGMRDPVANDPTIVPDTVAVVPNGSGGYNLAPGATGTTGTSASTTSTSASTTSGNSTLVAVLIAAAIGFLLVMEEA